MSVCICGLASRVPCAFHSFHPLWRRSRLFVHFIMLPEKCVAEEDIIEACDDQFSDLNRSHKGVLNTWNVLR